MSEQALPGDAASPGERLRDRFASRGEEAFGRIAQDLLDNPWVNSAVTAALDARGRASQAQEVAMDFLNLPSAAQIERLTRRVRAVSQRLEAIEDTLARLEDSLRGAPAGVAGRLDAVEQRLAELSAQLAAARAAPEAVAPGQERLRVEEPPPPSSAGALG